MQRAILFWYYRDPDVCTARLAQLTRLNPGWPIYGLYGGPPEHAAAFLEAERALSDVWRFDEVRNAEWKWLFGDRMLARWYRERGHALAWDSLFIAQWDFLACAPLAPLFDVLEADQVLLPGLRPLDGFAARWWWTRADSPEAPRYAAFQADMRARGYIGPFEACQFLAALLPRAFLAAYTADGSDAPGFLEYKLPAWARLLGFRPVTLPALPVIWPGEPARRSVLRATKQPIDTCDILSELIRPHGARYFHPVHRPLPTRRAAWAGLIAANLPRLVLRGLRATVE